MTARSASPPTGWRLAPGVRRLGDGRLLGGSPMRVIRLGAAGETALRCLLGRADHPQPGTAAAQLSERLQRYGLLTAPPPPAGPLEDITVVIPARTTAAVLARLLASLPDVAVVLVDDGSPVPLEDLPQDPLPRSGRISHLRHESSLGPAAARNAGAGLATTSWLAFIDADVLLSPQALQQLASDTARIKGLVAIGPRISNRRSTGPAALVETYAGALDLGPVAGDVSPRARVSYLSTALLLVNRAAFEAVGGFDPSLRVAEDVDLIWRLVPLGRVRYQPSVVVGHEPRVSGKDVLRRRHFYGTGAALLAQRHPGLIRHADVSLWTLVPWTLAIVVHPLVGLTAAAAVVALAPRRIRDLGAFDALRVVAAGEIAGWQALGVWLLRPLWPLTLALALALPARRNALAAAVLLGVTGVSATAWRGDAAVDVPAHSPRVVLATVASRTLVDAAYSLGVWQGCLRQKRLAPLLPRVRGVRSGPR